MALKNKIGLVDYGMGNLGSVAKALKIIGHESRIISSKKEMGKVDMLVLPGVGSFGSALENLKKYRLFEEVNSFAYVKKKPFLGICLGAQLATSSSEENGYNEGYEWFDTKVLRLPSSKGIQVPHVGWNSLRITKKSLLWTGIKRYSNFYFDHSYYITKGKYTNSETLHGIPFSATLENKNIICAQFHPEKSQINGLRFLRNFINLSQKYL